MKPKFRIEITTKNQVTQVLCEALRINRYVKVQNMGKVKMSKTQINRKVKNSEIIENSATYFMNEILRRLCVFSAAHYRIKWENMENP